VSNDDDCDDGVYAINPDADEECDAIDHDCDGEDTEIDAIGCMDYHYDYDGDGYGLIDDYLCMCSEGEIENYTVPASEVSSTTDDCCDIDWHSKPGASWVTGTNACGSWDEDCDGDVEYRYNNTYEDCDVIGCEPEHGSGGWNGSKPGCGVSASYVEDCNTAWMDGPCGICPDVPYCAEERETRTQQCK